MERKACVVGTIGAQKKDNFITTISLATSVLSWSAFTGTWLKSGCAEFIPDFDSDPLLVKQLLAMSSKHTTCDVRFVACHITCHLSHAWQAWLEKPGGRGDREGPSLRAPLNPVTGCDPGRINI